MQYRRTGSSADPARIWANSVPGAVGAEAHKVTDVIVTRTDHDFVDLTINKTGEATRKRSVLSCSGRRDSVGPYLALDLRAVRKVLKASVGEVRVPWAGFLESRIATWVWLLAISTRESPSPATDHP